ncbi:sialidase family protein [Massilia glaciei]|uniref:Exo-alpha-sialidase n=1 Tax=Massilia glaciei TaxID=1524097 RepID=A0A2U2HKG2_9BURK|nr:sialidase family protein [Massilia glaciei]PWF47990.1 exo-alpha-sialidase [Massilia glaciei]
MNMIYFLRALCWFALFGAAHAHGAMAHGAPKPELGTSAAVDGQGRLWIASKEAASDADQGQYLVLRSTGDNGATWSAPKRIGPEALAAEGESRPKLAFGTRGEIYVAYTRPLAKPYTGEIRFARSLDGGETFSRPVTVHLNRDEITHRFESLIVDRAGRVYIAWIDKRDREAATARKRAYRGAAVYYAVSSDGGASFRGDFKIADHSCECCRIALALNANGAPVALWRHVFAPNARDHAMRELTPDGRMAPMQRASFDDWRIDACPHHGPALAYAADGTRHQAWFNLKGGQGGVFYAAARPGAAMATPATLGTAQARHADIAVRGDAIALAWKQFDGGATAIVGRHSGDAGDAGASWTQRTLASTSGHSDHPRLLATPSGIVLVWRTEDEGVRVVPVGGGAQ